MAGLSLPLDPEAFLNQYFTGPNGYGSMAGPPLNLDNLGLGQPWSNTNPAIQADNGTLPGGQQALDTARKTIAGVQTASAGGDAPAAGIGEAAGTGNAVAGDSIAGYFLRGVIIVLGFIFVAAGLAMFRNGAEAVPHG